jgi:hypothetical protein
MKTKLILLATTIAVIFAGCKGDTGPQGPAGGNGAANVSNTAYSAIPGVWNLSGAWWYIDVSVPALTNASIDLVQVYVQTMGSGTDWWALPAKDLVNNGDNFQFSYVSGIVRLWYTYTSAPSSTWTFRIVVVPPPLARPNVNYSNYSEVKASYNLQD